MEISGSASQYAIEGMRKGFDQLDKASQQVANPNEPDKASGLIETKQSETQVQASAKSFKAADDRIGTLLDVIA